MKKLTLVALALIVASCTSGDGEESTTTVESTTTTITTTTTVPETTTTTPTTTEPPFTERVVVYVLDPSGGNESRPGPFLYPISVAPMGGSDPLEAALVALVGITGFDSAVPEASAIEGLSVEGDIVEVDLSDEFAGGGGTFSMTARLAQLTYTLTAVDGVDGVLLVDDGDPVEVFSSEGLVLDGPMVRDDFEDLLPGILVDEPAAGAAVELPLRISGVAAAFEGVFQMEILQRDDVVFAPDFVSTDTGIGWGEFEVVADIEAEPGDALTIRVWEFSARDGSVVSERLVPVTVAR